MYIPEQFTESNIGKLQEFIRARCFATVVTMTSNGLNANHIPLLLNESPGPYGSLQGHIARVNPIIDDYQPGLEALAIFNGPDCYISPNWYSTKKENARVVPTWNYMVVHAYGNLRRIDNRDWLLNNITALTECNEASLKKPWAISDAPAEFIETLLDSIVGFEMRITRLIGKYKVSQNQPIQNQASVAAELRQNGLPAMVEMARLIENQALKSG